MPKKTENVLVEGLAESEPIKDSIILSPAENGGEPPPPSMDEPEWQDYVMGHFVPEELENGYPRVKGLVRVVKKLLGAIIDGRGHAVQHPNESNEYRATAEYTLVINKTRNLAFDEEPGLRTFTDIGDAYHENINGPKDFKVCQPRIASTRAQARACRQALGLFVVAAEELASTDTGFDGQISENLITKIDIKCSQLDINVMKFINQFRGSAKAPRYENISEVTLAAGGKMFGLLNEYQQKVKEIPPTIIGYNSEWRANA